VLKALLIIAAMIAVGWFAIPVLWGLLVQGFRAIQNALLAIIAILMAIAGIISFAFFCCSDDETGALWAGVAGVLFVVGFVIYRL